MRLIADTHVHVYPCYTVRQALDHLRLNLAALDTEAVSLAFLAERSDCSFFMQLQHDPEVLSGAQVVVFPAGDAILIREETFSDLYVFPGRQIITRERIEILALTVDPGIPDGLPAEEVMEKVRSHGGIPVVSWAPGKWFFQRKQVVERLLQKNDPGTFLIGDTTLRPLGWMRPPLMRRAEKKGFVIVAGSDPLPFSGEEKVVGSYATAIEAGFDRSDPAASLRRCLSRPGERFSLVGRRGNPGEVLLRLIRNARSKKNTAVAMTVLF